MMRNPARESVRLGWIQIVLMIVLGLPSLIFGWLAIPSSKQPDARPQIIIIQPTGPIHVDARSGKVD